MFKSSLFVVGDVTGEGEIGQLGNVIIGGNIEDILVVGYDLDGLLVRMLGQTGQAGVHIGRDGTDGGTDWSTNRSNTPYRNKQTSTPLQQYISTKPPFQKSSVLRYKNTSKFSRKRNVELSAT